MSFYGKSSNRRRCSSSNIVNEAGGFAHYCKVSPGRTGATFGSESHDDAKLATITFGLSAGDGDIKEQVADVLGSAIINLSKLEETLPEALEQIADEKAAVMETITVA